MNITITRESELVYVAQSDRAYWSDGSCINERLAFSDRGTLSNLVAQGIDRRAGNSRYLICPFGIQNRRCCEEARRLAIGQSVVVPIQL